MQNDMMGWNMNWWSLEGRNGAGKLHCQIMCDDYAPLNETEVSLPTYSCTPVRPLDTPWWRPMKWQWALSRCGYTLGMAKVRPSIPFFRSAISQASIAETVYSSATVRSTSRAGGEIDLKHATSSELTKQD